jgi:TIR domain
MSASVTNQEIFLSYARADNVVPEVDRHQFPGWVKHFYDHLSTALLHRIEGEHHFWRDVDDIEPDARFAGKIEAALRQATLMIAVVSYKYIVRPWCLKELRTFYDLCAGPDEDARAERIVKILKHNVPEDRLPDPLQNRGRGFRFFDLDPVSQEELPYFFNGRLMDRHEQAFFDVLNKIVEVLVRRLRPRKVANQLLNRIAYHCEADDGVTVEPTARAKRTVFVAVPPAGSSVVETYIALTCELTSQGITVLPKPRADFPDTLADAERVLDEALTGAALAVHLIGENHGKTCDGADEPMVQLQLRSSAMGPTVSPGLRRLIWLPNEVKPANERQRAFLAALRNFDASALPLRPGQDDVVADSYDSFRDLVSRTLAPGNPPVAGRQLNPVDVYAVAADADVLGVRSEIRRLLASGGANVNAPCQSPSRRSGERSTRRLASPRRTSPSWSGAARRSPGSRNSSTGSGDQRIWAGPSRSGRSRS